MWSEEESEEEEEDEDDLESPLVTENIRGIAAQTVETILSRDFHKR